MPSLRPTSTRVPSPFAIPLLALPLSCTGDDGEGGEEVSEETTGETTGDGDGDGDGEGGPCTEPGMSVPGIDPFVPAAEDPLPTCAEGWASATPLEDAAWVIAIEQADPGAYYYYTAPPIVRALPGKQAVVAQGIELQWYDGEGQPTATIEHGFDVGFNGLRPGNIVARDDGHVFVTGPTPGGDIVVREFADGELVGEIDVPTPGDTNSVVALQEFSPDEWLIVGNEFDPMEGSEMFFMRVDAQGETVLRKATSGGYSYYYSPYATFGVLDAASNLLFGSQNSMFLVDATSGMVVGNPALAGMLASSGSLADAGFAWVSQGFLSSGDALVTAINGFAVQQWTQTYERILNGNDIFWSIAGQPEGGYVVGGSEDIWWPTADFVTRRQPLVIAVDAEGGVLWKSRLAIPGETRSVDVAGDGSVVAAGIARTGGVDYSNTDDWLWVAAW